MTDYSEQYRVKKSNPLTSPTFFSERGSSDMEALTILPKDRLYTHSRSSSPSITLPAQAPLNFALPASLPLLRLISLSARHLVLPRLPSPSPLLLLMTTTTRLVRPPRLLGFGGRPYNFFERDALPQNLSSVLVRFSWLSMVCLPRVALPSFLASSHVAVSSLLGQLNACVFDAH